MNLQNLMAQAQKMQREMAKKTKELDDKKFEFGYQNNSIVVNIMGSGKIVDIKISDVLIDPEDKLTLEEMIAEAINYANEQVKKYRDEITASMMPKGAAGMPGLF